MKVAHETNACKNIAAARGRREDDVVVLLLLLLVVVVAKIIVVVVLVVLVLVVVWYSPRRWCLFVKEEETFGRGFFREVFFGIFERRQKKDVEKMCVVLTYTVLL